MPTNATAAKPFAERLKFLREAAGLTVYRLSAMSGVRQTAIAKLEAGERTDPHFSTVCKLADALRVSVSKFR